MLAWLRRRDRAAAEGVDQFIANSQHVASRIRRHYGREATVIYPPVDVDFFTPSGEPEDFYLIVSRLVPYKRVDVAVEAFNRLHRPLVIAGDGPERGPRQSMPGPHGRSAGELGDPGGRRPFPNCRALLVPAFR